jgi:hypothetical protein
LGEFALQIVIGAAVGLAGGQLLSLTMRRLQLPGEGLYPLRTLAIAIGLYGAATVAHGSGFLAVFVAGIMIGDIAAPFKREIERFHTSLASLAEIIAFVVLGLTVSLTDLVTTKAWLIGGILALLLAFVVRPLLVGPLLLATRLRAGEKVFVLWAGLKGAVPILLGTYILAGGPPRTNWSTRSSSWWSPSPSSSKAAWYPPSPDGAGSRCNESNPDPGHWVSDCVINPKGRAATRSSPTHPPMADQCANYTSAARYGSASSSATDAHSRSGQTPHCGPVTKSSFSPTPKSKPTTNESSPATPPKTGRDNTPQSHHKPRTRLGYVPVRDGRQGSSYMPNRARRTASTAAAGPTTSTCAAPCRPKR